MYTFFNHVFTKN